MIRGDDLRDNFVKTVIPIALFASFDLFESLGLKRDDLESGQRLLDVVVCRLRSSFHLLVGFSEGLHEALGKLLEPISLFAREFKDTRTIATSITGPLRAIAQYILHIRILSRVYSGRHGASLILIRVLNRIS